MKIPDDDYLLERKRQIARKKQIIIYISFLSFGMCMLVSGFHTVFQAWEGSDQPAISSHKTKSDKLW